MRDKQTIIIDPSNLKEYTITGKCLCIDPGLSKIGWILFEFETLAYLSSGIIKTDASTRHEIRLMQIYESVQQLVLEYQPTVIVVERINFISYKTSKTIESIFMRAVGIISIVCMNHSVFYMEISPTTVHKLMKDILTEEEYKMSKTNRKQRAQLITKRMINNEKYTKTVEKKINHHVSDAALLGCCIYILYFPSRLTIFKDRIICQS